MQNTSEDNEAAAPPKPKRIVVWQLVLGVPLLLGGFL
jgi:hypothetical protein